MPGGGLLGISGVESGNAAPLVGGPPGVELHTVVDELPSGATGDVLPVVLLRIGEGMVPSGVADIIASDDIVAVDELVVAVVPGTDVGTMLDTIDGAGTGTGAMVGDGRAGTAGGGGAGTVELGNTDMNDVAGCADRARNCVVVLSVVGVDEIVGAVGPGETGVTDVEVTGTVVPDAICPVGVEQVTTVPGVVGSEAIGTGASVVSGMPGWVVAENGLGPLSGEVTIAPGVVARPMDVVPKVETCARHAVQPPSRVTIVSSKRRIGHYSFRDGQLV